jgi:hypothetical protein
LIYEYQHTELKEKEMSYKKFEKKKEILVKRVLLCSLLLVICSLPSVYGQSGVVRELSGTVEIKASGAASYLPAKSGDRVNEDTIISTGFKSTALIEAGSTLIVVRPLTRLTLAEIRSAMGTETLNVNLQAGRVRVDSNPPAGTRASTTLTCPTATASVRGTSFEMDTRRIIVVEGVVGYQGNRSSKQAAVGSKNNHGTLVIVYAGYESDILTNGKSTNPYAAMLMGFRPSTPVGYDPYCGPSRPAGPSWQNIASQPPSPPPSSPRPPYGGGGGGSGGGNGGGSGNGGGPVGPSGPGGTSEGDITAIVVDSW